MDLVRLLDRLFRHVSASRRIQCLMLLGLMLISALAEVVSLGAVLPFLAILSSPENAFNHPALAGLIRALGIATAPDLKLPLTLIFAAAALAAGGLRVLLTQASIRFAFDTGADFSMEAYRRALHQPYHLHLGRNTSEVISGIVQKVGTATHVLLSMVILLSSSLLFAAIMLALFAINAVVTTAVAIGLGAIYALITTLSRQRLERNSQRIAREQVQLVKALQEGLGGIRDVLLNGTQSTYIDIYRKADQRLREALADNLFVSMRPRYVMEAMGMALIAGLAYGTSLQPGGVEAAVPVLGALALGAQRALPALQQVYASWITVAGGRASVNDVLDLLEQSLPDDALKSVAAPISFRKEIRFESVRYRYGSDGPWVLDNFNLTIPKGARLGLVGRTGSGKSTALDLLLFLLEPTQGSIVVDGQPITRECRQTWQRIIAHVPQNIYLADATVAENIAFGVPSAQIDLGRVREAARRAQLSNFVERQPEGYLATVGERGVRLSGGERQRIGIARALYKQATIIVFDEATNALDDLTERAVMQAIDGLDRDLTIIIIAHRATTVQHCHTIVHLENGKVVAQGSYEELMARHPGAARFAGRSSAE